MSENVNMQQAEYDILQEDLKDIHEKILEKENEIRQTIIELVSPDGGFYVKKISEKIDLLMEKMQSGAMAKLKEAFNNTEEAVASFAATVKQTDVAEG